MKNLILVFFVSMLLVSCGEPEVQSVQKPNTLEAETVKEDSLAWINAQILKNPNDANMYLVKAKYFLSHRDLVHSIEEVDRAIGIDSTNVNYFIFKGDALYDANNLVDAKTVYLQALALNEKNIHANLKMGWISLIAGLHEDCFVYCNNVLKVDQYLAEPYYLKGLAYKELGNFKLAVSNFRTSTEQDNDYLESWLQLGYMYDAAEDTLAGAFYENAMRIDSNNTDAIYAMAMHLQSWGLTDEAIAEYHHLIRVNSGYHDAYFNLGYVYLEMLQEFDSAVKYYDKVIQLNKFNFKGYYNRGLAYEKMDLIPQARNDFEETLKLKPDYTPAA
ncbi:MAG: tetratricopeptide repeat protein, partial [Bacteroidia bacterium]